MDILQVIFFVVKFLLIINVYKVNCYDLCSDELFFLVLIFICYVLDWIQRVLENIVDSVYYFSFMGMIDVLQRSIENNKIVCDLYYEKNYYY